ncbi:MAG: adenosine deaminase [Propionibacteriaceae bacterium]|jgi:adenosine deaminase|nr:adenosine deaminase [Propionibacteriaceae bacterium]
MRTFAELHLHIEGTLEPELVVALAERNGIRLPEPDAARLRELNRFTSLPDFLARYTANQDVLRTEQDFTDLADAYLARARASGVVRAEIFCDLQAHLARGIAAETVLNGLGAALSRSEADHGVSTGLIITFLRDQPVEQAEDAYVLALASGVDLLGVGLCSAEIGFPAAPFVPLFARARADGLQTVAHAGEEGGPEVVWEALRQLRVGRIDHGVHAADDPELVAHLAESGIPLTMCPLSNRALQVVPDLSRHPLPGLLAAGVRVTVNSDDPAYFGGYLDANLAAITDACGLTDADLDALARNSIEASFLPAAEKLRLTGTAAQA